ncbi:fructosamine kinase family protein [Catellatospora sichuanensis]|uniref:fructosamine kinase family protein n=1 Tax=Catellatospora sichuanensis TaxID=1969805 RepID=UPI001FE35CD2|nr:fructosamine kinase family protein [Catellatospora sichuanensis]
MATPEVILANRELLVLSVLRPRPRSETFWERFAHELARLHMSTTHPRFGWHRDNWLGRRRQANTWDDDGFTFFAQHRLLRWLGEPRVEAALDAGDRAALERLCHRLPDLLPDRPACLTHGDLWAQNVLATPDGEPALIDPAVSYMWAEVDLAHVWSTAPPPEAQRFFEVYAELTSLDGDWRARMPIVQLRQHLAVIAQFDDDWGAGDQIRATLAPFRQRCCDDRQNPPIPNGQPPGTSGHRQIRILGPAGRRRVPAGPRDARRSSRDIERATFGACVPPVR